MLECVVKRKAKITSSHIEALQVFVRLNREGFRKILKKWDKKFSKDDGASRMRNVDKVLVNPLSELDLLISGATPSAATDDATAAMSPFMKFMSRPSVIFAVVVSSLGAFAIALAFGVEANKVANTFFVGVVASFTLALANGANDIANSVGTSVGSGAITLRQAVVFGCIFEFAGALIIGKNVAKSISKGMIEPAEYFDTPDM